MPALAWRLAMYGLAILSAALIGLWGASSIFFLLTYDEKFIYQAFPHLLIGGLALGLSGVCYSYYEEKLEDIHEKRKLV
jgi:O-antigen/teichoic acid export membrane protein